MIVVGATEASVWP